MEPLLVRAARREPVERTPVWFMRQAGRSLPEYREIRKHHGLFEVCRQPELCAEVTLQPVRRHGVDAAVMFADIMLPVLGMGVDVDLVENVGPVVGEPVRTQADVDRLRTPEPEESVPFVLEAVRLVREELRDDQAVIGFCGGPFTVAGYLVEGKPTREFTLVKTLMYREPEVWHALMDKLADGFARYVRGKVRAGADVIQVFDSWVGALSPADYEEFVAPYSARILAAVDVPTIHFGTGTATLLFSESPVVRVWRRDDQQVGSVEHFVQWQQPIIGDVGVGADHIPRLHHEDLAELEGERLAGVVAAALERHAQEAHGEGGQIGNEPPFWTRGRAAGLR